MNNQMDELTVEAQLFSRITFISAGLFLAVGGLALFVYIFYGSPVAQGLAILIIGVQIPVSFYAHHQARRGQVERAAMMLAFVWYLISVGMIVVGERMYGVLIVSVTMPVLMTMPFVSQRLLRQLISASIVLILVGSVGAIFPPMITPTVPDQVMLYIQAFVTSAISFVVMLSLWQSGGHLKTAVTGMREAISALQLSEKGLETKVEERTAELEHAFREMSDINEIAGVVNSTLDLNKVSDSIYDGLQRAFSFDQMGVFLLNPEDQRLRLRLQAGVPFAEELDELLVQDGLPLDAQDSFVAASVITRSAIYRGEITAEGLANAGASDLTIYQNSPMQSFLLCPLQIENKGIGCIFFVATEQPFSLNDNDIESIERYVMQLGTAIRNAQLFEQAEVARGEAESANETKGTFLANMSHEIRTPMNAIIGLTGLCLDTELSGKQEDYLTKVDGAANALRTIIDDILDFSKLEAGKFEFEDIPFSLNDVLDNLATICSVRCQEKQLELVFQRDPGLPDTLTGDPTRLGQILINLAGNAIKFTEEGQIIVEVRQTAVIEDKVTVHFDVRDSGIGMNEEQLGRLFQSFSQADSTISRQYGGTGLGLAISQQLAEMMGGQIEVSSEPGQGSSFHFTLEFAVASAEAAPTERDDAPQGLNVLVVDDNEASRDILNEYLVSFGYSVTLAESGEEALAIMRPEHSFDLVILDWMMPGMTGLDVALAIRDAESPPKIVLLSAWNMPSTEHEAMVDAFMPKPVKPSSLLDTIMLAYGKQVVKRRRHLGRGTAPEDLAGIRGAKVLVVDDSDINLQIACELLEKIPLTLDTASDGLEAVEMVRNNRYDCVLMDIQMPGMDGYAATAVIRDELAYDTLPILAMTANVMAEDRARTREAGMNGHVAKPVDPSELYLALAQSIPEADYSGNLPAGEIARPDSNVPAEQVSLPETLPGLDIQQGLSRVGNNSKLFVTLLTDLSRDYAEYPAQLRQLLNQGNADEARGMAHKLRGICNNLGALDTGNCAEVVETTLMAGGEVAPAQIDALEAALAVVIASANSLQELATPTVDSVAANDIDVDKVFGLLQQAVSAFDPGAVELVDQLLAVHDSGSEVARLLQAAREQLDNFSFADAEPLLQEAEVALQAKT